MNKKQKNQMEIDVRGPEYSINPTRDHQVLNSLLAEYQRKHQTINTIGRWTMLTHDYRFKTAVVVIIGLLTVGGLLQLGTQKVWALEHVLTALEEVQTIHIQGTLLYGRDYELMPFDLWMQAPDKGTESLRLYFKCRERIYVLEGDLAYECCPEEGIAKIKVGSEIRDFKYFYDLATLSPWFTSKMLKMLRQVATDWKQSITTDPDTGQEHITVSCRYIPTNMVYRMLIDPESKLITEAKLFGSEAPTDEPCVETTLIEYNQEIPPGTFALPKDTHIEDNEEDPDEGIQVPEGADEEVVREFIDLFHQAKPLFQQKETCEQALLLYQEICDTYPYPKQDDRVAYAHIMIGLCYRKLGQPQQEIEAYEKAVDTGIAHFTHGDLYYFLGRVYMEQGQNAKAIDAYENFLRDCQSHKDFDQFPREREKIQNWITEIKEKTEYPISNKECPMSNGGSRYAPLF